MSGFELRHLATLVAIAEEGTFGRAAARLGYTQSSVSQHVTALERTVGAAVFDRPGGPRPVRLTPLGAVILEHARTLLDDTNRLSEAVDRHLAGDGRVDIGTFQSVSTVILPALVRRLRDERPRCDIRLFEEEPERPRIDDLDLLFHDRLVTGAVEHRKLLDDPYLLVARPGDLPTGPVRVRDLDGMAQVAWPEACEQPALEQALLDCGARPRIVFRTAGNETILSMVRAGMGVAVLPWLALHAAEAWSDRRLHVHELLPTPTRQIHLHWPARRSHSPLTARAVELAVDIAAKLSTQQ
ncbi:MAG: LysR family transcriptional regulator [Phycicoccus sp.]